MDWVWAKLSQFGKFIIDSLCVFSPWSQTETLIEPDLANICSQTGSSKVRMQNCHQGDLDEGPFCADGETEVQRDTANSRASEADMAAQSPGSAPCWLCDSETRLIPPCARLPFLLCKTGIKMAKGRFED